MVSSITDYIRAHLLLNLGVIEIIKVPDLEELRRCQWDKEFERLRLNRMLLGAFRYGLIRHGKQAKSYDNCGSIIERLQAYQQTGNLEHLLDIANLAMIEWMTSLHPRKHFHSLDDSLHTQVQEQPL